MMTNIPQVKLGIIAVSRDCFPIALSTQRRQNIVAAYGEGLYECPITVENETDALKALEDVKTEIVSIASLMAGKAVAASMDVKLQDSLIQETLKEMGESTWQS